MSKLEKRKLNTVVDSDEEDGKPEILIHDDDMDEVMPAYQKIPLEPNTDLGSEVEEFEFEIVELKEDDYQWVREQLVLPKKYKSLTDVDFGALTDALVKQSVIGSITKSGECPIGFLSVLSSELDDVVIKKVKDCIVSSVSGVDRKKIEDELKKHNIGLVFMEKLVNYPFGIIHPLHNSFAEDLEWVAGSESSLEEVDKQKYRFKKLLFFCQRESDPKADNEEQVSRKKRARGGDVEVFFADPEMDIIKEYAETVISCNPTRIKTFNNQVVTRQPCVLIFTLEDYIKAIECLTSLE